MGESEKHSDRITTVRVAVDARHQKGRKGHVYDVRIEVGVPGTELTVTQGPGGDARKEDLTATVRDAFKAAIRQVATERGIDVVLQLRDEEPAGTRPDQLSSEIFLTDVLHCDPSLDITADVLKILNR